jgi:hypothetical protein
MAVAMQPLGDSYSHEPGEYYGTPKQIWGFRTPAQPGRPDRIARLFLRANAGLFELDPKLAGLHYDRTVHGLGATHVIFQQHVLGYPVHRAYVSVHIDRAGRVYLSKNRAMPAAMCPTSSDFRMREDEAVRRAQKTFRGQTPEVRNKSPKRMWFPKADQLVPAWKVRLARRAQEWIVFVDARNGTILSRYDNVAAANGRGRVFDPNPVTALGGAELLIGPKLRPRSPPDDAYVEVVLRGLGDNGRLDGKRVSTAATDPRTRLRRPSLDFRVWHRDRGFEEVMVYYHIDAAIRYLEQLGYRGRKAIFRAPLKVDVNGTRDDNSWYSPELEQLTFGTGYVDDAEDAETILHELGHAIQDAICPDFGQSHQAAAMGEGFGDYFAASYFADRKPARYQPTVMSWNGLPDGLAARGDPQLASCCNPPCVRRLDERFTFKDFVDAPDNEHDNGRIWSATLWDIRCAVGRDVADVIILDSHFQLDAFTTFARGARAIIDADQNLYDGAHAGALARIFCTRAIQPL